MGYNLKKLPGYIEWYSEQAPKFKAQIEKRLRNIELYGHLGHIRDLKDGLFEIKFSNGARVCFARTGSNEITLLLGGNKHGQNQDIAKAKKLIR